MSSALMKNADAPALKTRIRQRMAQLHLLLSLTASAIVCGVLWTTGLKVSWQEWLLYWLGFSAITLIINQVCRFNKRA
jgi:hypothetical protein